MALARGILLTKVTLARGILLPMRRLRRGAITVHYEYISSARLCRGSQTTQAPEVVVSEASARRFDEGVTTMSTFEHTIEIQAPVETVFAFDTDPHNWTRTMSSLRNLEIVEEMETGARMHAVYKILGISQDVEMEMNIVEPNEHLHISVEGSGMGSEIDIHYSETDAGTQIAHGATYEFGDSLLDSVLEPVATRYTNRQFRMHLENTKDIVEAEAEAEVEAAAEADARSAA